MNKYDYAIDVLEEEIRVIKKHPESYYGPEYFITELESAIEVLKKEGEKE